MKERKIYYTYTLTADDVGGYKLTYNVITGEG